MSFPQYVILVNRPQENSIQYFFHNGRKTAKACLLEQAEKIENEFRDKGLKLIPAWSHNKMTVTYSYIHDETLDILQVSVTKIPYRDEQQRLKGPYICHTGTPKHKGDNNNESSEESNTTVQTDQDSNSTVD